jgi:hypothetical protein
MDHRRRHDIAQCCSIWRRIRLECALRFKRHAIRVQKKPGYGNDPCVLGPQNIM